MSQTPAGWYPSEGQMRWWDGERWTEHRQPMPTHAAAHPTTVVQPRKGGVPKWVKVGGGIAGGFVVLGAIGSAMGGGSSSSSATLITSERTSTSTAPAASKAAAPAPMKTTSTKAAIPSPAKTVVYRKLSARDWALIAKKPDGHIAEPLTVYGVVTQFDTVTGGEGFRADVDGVKHGYAYEYPTNTVLASDAATLENVVEGDIFMAKVMVLGSLSYETQIGGNTTVPQLMVIEIKVIGHK